MKKTYKEIAMYAIRNYGDNEDLKSACIQGAVFANSETRPKYIFTEEELEKLAKWFIRDNEVSWADLTEEKGKMKLLIEFYFWINAEVE